MLTHFTFAPIFGATVDPLVTGLSGDLRAVLSALPPSVVLFTLQVDLRNVGRSAVVHCARALSLVDWVSTMHHLPRLMQVRLYLGVQDIPSRHMEEEEETTALSAAVAGANKCCKRVRFVYRMMWY